MDKGKIVETGNHTTLLAMGGLYSKLVAASQNNPSEMNNVVDAIPVDRSAAGRSVQRSRSAAGRV
jgi:hypothetical protein